MSKFFDGLAKWSVLLLFSVMIVVLTVMSLFGNCMVNNDEYTYYIADRPWVHVLSFYLLLIIIYILRTKFRKRRCDDRIKKYAFYILMVAYFSCVIVSVLFVSMEPRADQKSVFDTAQAMLYGDYSSFKVDGYVGVYPNQVGIVYLFYWLIKIFPFGYKTVCVINAVMLVVIYVSMAGIGRILLEKNNKKWLTGIVTMMFFPLTLYVTFIYGNLIGQALSTVAIYYTLLYLNKHNVSSIVVASITAAMSVTIKENFIIPMVGIVIFLFLDFLRTKYKKTVVFICLLIVVTLGLGSVVKIHTENITGEKISKGVPTMAWIVMGMQEGYMAYGWHNQYNENVYRENACNTELTRKQVTDDFKERIDEMLHKPLYTLKFFYQKTLSQWNNPTFEGYWVNDLEKRKKDGIKVKQLSGFLATLAGEPGNCYVTFYCNVFQSLVLLGVIFWLVLGRKQIALNQLLLGTIFVGGFLFHLFWEAKCQYVIPYFVLLIPYCVLGYELLMDKIESVISKEHLNAEECKIAKNMIVKVVVVTVLIIVATTVGSKIIDKTFGFTENAYYDYIKTK